MIEFQSRPIKLPDNSRVMVSRVTGSIDGSTLTQFEDKLTGFLQEGSKYLILVLSQVKYINSTGMGILIKLADQFKAAGGDLTLVDVPEKLIALFNMLGLLVLIKVSKSEEDALKSFQGNKAAVSAPAPEAAEKKNITRGITAVESQRPHTSVITAQAQSAPATRRETAKIPSLSPGGSPITTSMAASSPAASTPSPSSAATPTITTTPTPKVFVVKCQKCQSNVSLGAKLRAGTYRCPKCMVSFKVSENGKILFMPS